MPDPAHFERHSELYDRARPPYPEELWQRLRTLGLLTPGTQALDLGAGSGQATGTLLSAGIRVTAVEPGPSLAAQLSDRFPQASVIVNTAENAVLPDAAYDLAVAATSIHWMNLSVVLPKVHRALVPGGHFLVWRNVFGDPRQITPFRAYVAEITNRRSTVGRPGPARRIPMDGSRRSRRVAIFAWSFGKNFGGVSGSTRTACVICSRHSAIGHQQRSPRPSVRSVNSAATWSSTT